MCAIIGSFDKNKLIELYNLNAYRGELSYSVCSFIPIGNKVQLHQMFTDKGKLPISLIEKWPVVPGQYFVAHSQAPTTQATNIHPAVYDDTLLWHNGIIKQSTIPEGTWDTEWMAKNVSDYGWSVLSRLNGTFACVMLKERQLFTFRNEISPLFIDSDMNISSTKFDGAESISPNNVYRIDIANKSLSIETSFETMENPYYFPDETTV